MATLIQPDPTVNDIDYDETHAVVFLAGPIQGAPNWQYDAALYLGENYEGKRKLIVANPRTPVYHGDYNFQVDWETRHLERASLRGVILFWLAKEETHMCERAYAQTSRFELGEWFGRRQSNHMIDLAVGIESGFTNERYIRRRLGYIYNSTLSSTLENTCKHAISLLYYQESR